MIVERSGGANAAVGCFCLCLTGVRQVQYRNKHAKVNNILSFMDGVSSFVGFFKPSMWAFVLVTLQTWNRWLYRWTLKAGHRRSSNSEGFTLGKYGNQASQPVNQLTNQPTIGNYSYQTRPHRNFSQFGQKKTFTSGKSLAAEGSTSCSLTTKSRSSAAGRPQRDNGLNTWASNFLTDIGWSLSFI